YSLNLAAYNPAREPYSLAGPNLLPATHFKGHSFADPCTLKSSTVSDLIRLPLYLLIATVNRIIAAP
ncbi:hypothetical protein BKA60DRAFT_465940, partial [Fusarium oxysporum]